MSTSQRETPTQRASSAEADGNRRQISTDRNSRPLINRRHQRLPLPPTAAARRRVWKRITMAIEGQLGAAAGLK